MHNGLKLAFLPNEHILGSVFVRIHNKKHPSFFLGDIGRPNDILMKPPARIKQADCLVVESAYGNRLHEHDDTKLCWRLTLIKLSNAKGG